MIADILYIMTAICAAFFVACVLIMVVLYPTPGLLLAAACAYLYIRYKGNYS